jgi:transposase-like protein
MKTTTQTNSVSKLYCNVFGHQYEVSKQVTFHVKEYTCKCCKRQLTTNSNGNLTELTPKFKEINKALEYIYTRRMMRSQQKLAHSSIY